MPAILDFLPIETPPEVAPAVRQLNKNLESAPILAGRKASQGQATLISPDGISSELPSFVYELLRGLVQNLATGNAVFIAPVHAELTTRQAAELLRVSRPHLVKLLDSHEIPSHRVGAHRRMKLSDVLIYQRQREAKLDSILDRMTRIGQLIGD